MTPRTRSVVLLIAPLLLYACGQPASPQSSDPYAGGASYPWTYTRPDGQLSAQTLTPGINTLYYEPILAAANGWGPIEINRSNGEQGAGDGRPITLDGMTYSKGFGVHAGSEMRFSLKGTGATCTRFTADIGVDDEVGNRGSVVFQVYLDGVKAYDSGVMTGGFPTMRPSLNITGRQELRLVVTDGGDGIAYDHADWANPKITCQAVTAPLLTMTVAPDTLEIFHKHTATVRATFSGTFSGPVNLAIPLISAAGGSPLTLRTTQVDLPASGSGTVTRDVVIEAPAVPSSLGDPALLTAQYRLVASQGGQERASAPLTVTEKLLTVNPFFTPTSVTGRVGETRRVTVAVQVSPPLAQPTPISLFPTTQATSDAFSAVPVGLLYGDGATMKQDFDITLNALPANDITSFTAQYYVEAGGPIGIGFTGYRLLYYGSTERSLTWNVQP